MLAFFKSTPQSEEDESILKAIRDSHESLKVVGRGTVVISPKHVANTDTFKIDLERAKKLVRG